MRNSLRKTLYLTLLSCIHRLLIAHFLLWRRFQSLIIQKIFNNNKSWIFFFQMKTFIICYQKRKQSTVFRNYRIINYPGNRLPWRLTRVKGFYFLHFLTSSSSQIIQLHNSGEKFKVYNFDRKFIKWNWNQIIEHFRFSKSHNCTWHPVITAVSRSRHVLGRLEKNCTDSWRFQETN